MAATNTLYIKWREVLDGFSVADTRLRLEMRLRNAGDWDFITDKQFRHWCILIYTVLKMVPTRT